jgi:transcriptional regulator with XRE-family HTH domain
MIPMVQYFSGALLRASRRRRSLAPEQLAVASGLPAEILIKFEKNKAVPSLNAAAMLAEVLGVNVTEFLSSGDPDEPASVAELPGWAQDYIRQLRAEAASNRARAREAVQAAAQ